LGTYDVIKVCEKSQKFPLGPGVNCKLLNW